MLFLGEFVYVKLVHRNSLMLNESVGVLLCLPLCCCLSDGVHYCGKVKEAVFVRRVCDVHVGSLLGW